MAKSKKNLYTFSFKLLLLIGVLVGVLRLLFLPYVPDIGTDKRFMYTLNKTTKNIETNYQMVFLGSSLSFTAYDCSTIKHELGLNSIHVNSSAQKLETTLLVADYLLKENNGVKFMVFDVSNSTLPRPHKSEKKTWYYQTLALQELPFSLNKSIEATKFFPIKEYPEYYVASLSKEMGRIFRLNARSNYQVFEESNEFKSSKNNIMFTFNGYLPKQHFSLSREEFVEGFNKEPGPSLSTNAIWDKELRKKLAEFIEKAKKHGVKVILVNSLKLLNENYNKEFIEVLMRDNENVRFLNLNSEREKYFLNENSFYDYTHLNYSGSYQVTQRMCDSLSQWYGLPKQKLKQYSYGHFTLEDAFYNLEETQDKFIKLRFDQLPDEINEHQLVISLFPKDTSKLSQHSKNRGFGSDNFYFRNPSVNSIDVGDSKIIILKMNTKITNSDIDGIKVYFYKGNDTLRLPSHNIQLNDAPSEL